MSCELISTSSCIFMVTKLKDHFDILSENIKMSRAAKVLAGLAALQEEGTLCDVELKAEQQTIPAHKAVLAAATPYFAAMFTGKFKERKSRVITVKDVTFTGLKNVVDCIYTTEIKINAENIGDILPAAHLLQMTDIVEECKDWMSRKITKNNCFKFLQLAEKYGIETVEVAITDFVLNNFVAVSKTKGFTEISQHALCRYLASDTLNTGLDELAVYQAAKTWIVKNKITDSNVILDIMKNVRFGLILPYTLASQVTVDNLIDDHKDCRILVSEAAKYHSDVFNQPFYDGYLNKPRGKTGLLVISNGLREEGGYNAKSDGYLDFLPLPQCVPAKQSKSLDLSIVFNSMSAVHVNNFLFLFGSKCDGYQNFTMRYDASIDSWIKLDAVPREATIGSSVACSEGKKEVFLIGGMPVSATSKFGLRANKAISNVFSYNIQNNTWSQCRNLPEGLIYARAATLNNHVFVTGGYSANGTTDSVYAYDIKAKLWLTKAKMNYRRCQHTLDAVSGKLYAIGGRIVDGRNITSVEAYDSLSNQWTVALIDGPELRGTSSLVIENKIYIIGGYEPRNMSLYEVDTKKVRCLTKELPSFSLRNVSAFLTLPKLL